MRWRNLLFDFDGTLVDSSSLHAEAYHRVLDIMGRGERQKFDYTHLMGLTTRAAFARLGIRDPRELDACVARKQWLYREAVSAGGLKTYEGARDLLRASKEGGACNFLVTSGSADSINRALEVVGIRELFTGFITAGDVAASKPAPDPYLACLARYKLIPGDSIVIEDAPSGIVSARAAGLKVAGVHNTEVAQMADWYFPTLAELSIALEL
ncbi:MAG TPA: HAD family hydrolase [Candidatus Binataceae bacterium]|nr:HAD family hydrolase [Candidatus Binataceae bacterium]